MVSKSTYNILGYIYTGLCLTGSLLLIINVSTAIEATGVSVTGILILLTIIVCFGFDLVLVFGIVMRRVDFIRIHKRFVVTVYVLVLVTIFIGSIVGATFIHMERNAQAGLVTFLTFLCILGIVITTVVCCFCLWILNGFISAVGQENHAV
ncbi:uncharacterized protein LOC129743000 isoform X2 [Uranotaenia lowii]|uniref:uncharacterized protein LOC129743000 isoform X2 n=1 Tax=Uranotaenia lowii TaxID=190385 RepID=UPI0024788F4C|nr:uncharacterized protein LOC129743000 isoform X2 [Uranotaenia lowii]